MSRPVITTSYNVKLVKKTGKTYDMAAKTWDCDHVYELSASAVF